MRTRLLSATLLVILVTVSACTEQPSVPRQPEPELVGDGMPQPSPTQVWEGPADQPAGWADKTVSVRLDRVERMPRNLTAEMPAANTAVKVTWTIINDSDSPIPLENQEKLNVWYGANRYSTSLIGGYAGEPGEKKLNPELPTRVAPKGNATLAESVQIPTKELGTLAVNVLVPGRDLAWTFTGVEKILR